MDKNCLPIAVFDSGLGGISVLRELRKLLPHENFIYFGDTANAPYGTRTAKEVRELTFSAYDALRERGIKAFVIACNTATSVAVSGLRERYPEDIIVGVEPALKPAVLSSLHPTVAVLATPLTLKEEKFLSLLSRFEASARIIPFACEGLVEFVERGQTEGEELECFLSELLAPLRSEKPDCVVLGCTHYPFVKDTIRKVLGSDMRIFDGSAGTAKQTQKRLAEQGLLNTSDALGKVDYLDSSYPDEINPCGSMVFRFGGENLCN